MRRRILLPASFYKRIGAAQRFDLAPAIQIIESMTTFLTLEAWLAHLEAAQQGSPHMDLTRIAQVKNALGFSFDCPVITVSGTNGKGSACAILETILLRAGYRVGCYTSPHLLAFNERARINGADATDIDLLEQFEAVERARASLKQPVALTSFEFATLAILRLFASRGLDAVILEAGIGGRLDAVNVIDTDCAIVTSVDIDHTDYLGDTREKIGFEKAGIFREGKPAICGDPAPPQSLIDHAQAIGIAQASCAADDAALCRATSKRDRSGARYAGPRRARCPADRRRLATLNPRRRPADRASQAISFPSRKTRRESQTAVESAFRQVLDGK
ncbi:hypothetical protein PPGU19_085430 (plasmid) [Paraburkholderia sp. PGU19]|nr:hypothetical protein PPGU19_085430 [Paraburkholderia sp. PGU19]